MGFRFLSTASLALVLLAFAAAHGQEPAIEDVPPSVPTALDDLDTYLLRDANGKLVPVVGMKF